MKSKKMGYAIVAFTLITAAPLSHAVYMDTFQGLTFSFDQTDSDTLSFNIAGTLGGDWASATHLGAFGLKNLGLDFSSGGATAKIFSGPGAAGLVGLNSELSNGGNSIDCLSNGTPDAAICFDIDPDYLLPVAPLDLTYIIDFSKDLDISDAGPHLKIAFTAYNEKKGKFTKVGSLYSDDVGMVPEPSILALMGLGLVGIGFFRRKVTT